LRSILPAYGDSRITKRIEHDRQCGHGLRFLGRAALDVLERPLIRREEMRRSPGARDVDGAAGPEGPELGFKIRAGAARQRNRPPGADAWPYIVNGTRKCR
jgi:hypothetical protein